MLCAIVRMRISICVRDFACNIWQSALVTMYVTVTMSSSWAVLAAAFCRVVAAGGWWWCWCRVKKREKVMCDVVGSAAWVGLRGLHCRNFTDLLLADRLRLLVPGTSHTCIHVHVHAYYS